MQVKTFPTLYKKTSTGAVQYWKVSTENNVIHTFYGKVDGKEQTTSDAIKEGKNQGKVNQTSPSQQAEAEAKSLWNSKLKKGYVQELSRASKGETNQDGKGYIPMLAHKFSEQGHKITYPCIAQPKLDGIRSPYDGNGKLFSRTRKEITSMPHIINEIKLLGLQDLKLDGELYNHKFNSDFEGISHRVKRNKSVNESKEVQFHIYDVNHPGTNLERQILLRERFKDKESSILVLVETITIESEEDLMLTFEKHISQGYEGTIVRNINGLYVSKRSYDMQKIKEFDDAEFLVVGVKEGKGKLAGHAIFICKTLNGSEFEAKLKGPISELKRYFTDSSLWKGKKLTVQYQGITNKKKVPRFAVALRIREDE